METFAGTITQYATLIGFLIGLCLGGLTGWVARGIYNKRKKDNEVHSDALAAIISILVIALWVVAHLNNIFFGGADVNWILNVIGGLAVSSLIQEKDGFIKIITAVRGGAATKNNNMRGTIFSREYRKLVSHWRLYLVMVLIFSFAPVAVDFLYRSYFPFDVSDAKVQPFPVVEDVVEPGSTLTYLVDINKNYPFPGTVNRYLQSDQCHLFTPIQPPIESNRAVGELKSHTTVQIPAKTTPCPYILVIEIVYHPTQWRALSAIKYTTDEFLVTNKKEEIEAIKDQADSIDEFIKDKVIEEEPSEEQNVQPGADF